MSLPVFISTNVPLMHNGNFCDWQTRAAGSAPAWRVGACALWSTGDRGAGFVVKPDPQPHRPALPLANQCARFAKNLKRGEERSSAEDHDSRARPQRVTMSSSPENKFSHEIKTERPVEVRNGVRTGMERSATHFCVLLTGAGSSIRLTSCLRIHCRSFT